MSTPTTERYQPYWFECSALLAHGVSVKRLSGCVWARSQEHALELGAYHFRERYKQYVEEGELDAPNTIKYESWVLPYQADPCFNPRQPLFCWTPTQCRGHTACPRNRSCTE